MSSSSGTRVLWESPSLLPDPAEVYAGILPTGAGELRFSFRTFLFSLCALLITGR